MMETVRAVIRLWRSPSNVETYLALVLAAVVVWQFAGRSRGDDLPRRRA